MAPQHDPGSLASKIKAEALSLGFDACGISRAGKLHDMEPVLRKWLNEGNHGAMRYMENHFEKRLDPTFLVEGAKSVIVVALGYYPGSAAPSQDKYIVSKYAYGRDYHLVIKEKLRNLEKALKQWEPGHKGRIFADSAPVMEKVWAMRAGLGWIGKNTCLIIPRKGSFYFLGELVTNIEMAEDQSIEPNHCGNCTKCLDACPTGALAQPGKLVAHRCISYLTIENKDRIPQEYRSGKLQGRIFGCDICQDVCPHNRFATPGTEPQLQPLDGVMNRAPQQWEQLDMEAFHLHFRKAKSPISRISFEKLQDNILAANAGRETET